VRAGEHCIAEGKKKHVMKPAFRRLKVWEECRTGGYKWREVSKISKRTQLRATGRYLLLTSTRKVDNGGKKRGKDFGAKGGG